MSITNPHIQNTHAILFVDDEEKALKMFKRLVSPQFTVLTAADVNEAKAVLAEKHEEIGVLITDQRMPGELGVDLLRYTRKKYPKIIRMLTTAYTDLDDAIDAVNTGEIFRYINKPWNADELLIDLNLAMNFFNIEQDRQQLIQEKMSLSHRQSRIEIMKGLIAMSGAQTHFNKPKYAVKSFLQQVAEPQILAEKEVALDASAYWETEINKTEKMIRINQSLNQWCEQSRQFIVDTKNSASIDYQACIDTIKQDQSINIILDNFDTINSDLSPSTLNQQGTCALMTVILQTINSQATSMSIHSMDQNIKITATTSAPNSRFSTQFLTMSDEEQDKQLGQLLAAYILVSHIDGSIKLSFDGAALTSIEVTLPQSIDSDQQDIKDAIWIEDLFVLYS